MSSAPPVRIPALLAASCEGDGPKRQAWLAELPVRIADLSARWQLRVGEPFEPGGNCAWVAPAIDADGRQVVLKVGWTHDESRDEAEGLAALAGEGAVEVYAFEHDGDTTSLLLERCLPGDELRTLGEPEQDEVIAGLLRRFWSVVPRPPLPATHPDVRRVGRRGGGEAG